MKHISTNIKDVAQAIDSQPRGPTTGITKLDDTIWGLLPETLIVIAGRSSMGKSAIMVDMALAASKETSVYIFSLEMSENLLKKRALCNLSSLNFHQIRRGESSVQDKDDLLLAATELEKRNIWIDDESGYLGCEQFWLDRFQLSREQTMDSKIEQGIKEGVRVFFVDFLQYLTYVGFAENNHLRYSRMTKLLYGYAKRYKVCIILLSQLRRFDQDRYKDDGKRIAPRPTLEDLKESGDIENHSNIVILLHRPQYYAHREIDLFSNVVEDDAELIIAKNRDAPTGSIRVKWLSYCMSFRDNEFQLDGSF